jgi:hypothetical protein
MSQKITKEYIKIPLTEALAVVNAAFSESYTIADWECIMDDNANQKVKICIAYELVKGLNSTYSYEFTYQEVIDNLITPYKAGVVPADIAQTTTGDDGSFFLVELN